MGDADGASSGRPTSSFRDAIEAMRIKAPTRGNRRLEALLDAANSDAQLKSWWHSAQVNAGALSRLPAHHKGTD